MLSAPKYSLAFALALAALGAGAQEISDPKVNSPFSRFGIGDVSFPGYATQSAMGGVGLAYSDLHVPNPLNPASLGALRFATYQVGVGVSRNTLTANGRENQGIGGNLEYLSLAFTTRNTLNDLFDARTRRYRYSTLVSVSPYSTQGYNIQLSSTQPEVGTVGSSFLGTGGFYRLRSSHALEIDRKLRLGIGLSYIFGRRNSQALLRTVDIAGSGQITDTESFRVRGVELEAGGQYDVVLAQADERPTKVLALGATFSYTGDLTGGGRRVITRQSAFPGLGQVSDTLALLDDQEQRLTMPLAFGGGFYYRKVNHYSFGADVGYKTWDRYDDNLNPDETLESGINVAVGAEYIPNYQSFNKYHNTIRYRVGAYYKSDPRPGVDADQGLTLGLGLPVIRPREELSYVNLSLNAGSLVTPGDIDQRYLRLTVGFALTDNTWFYKRRFK